MKIITLTYPLVDTVLEQINQQLSLAIGNFDGVHKGHQQVIGEAKRLAHVQNLKSAVMTFEPSPKAYFSKGEQYSKAITPLPAKLSLFEEMEIDYVLVVQFNESFSQITAQQFVQQFLTRLNVNQVVVGFDFRFGQGGQGDVQMLNSLADNKLAVHIVDAFILNGEKVSSTSVRKSLETGELHTTTTLLGRYYSLTGIVIGGDQRGRTIGFPTANLKLDEYYVRPALGVYAVKVTWKNKKYDGVLNFGMKPTFNSDEIAPVMEVHIIDFDHQIYGDELTIEWVHYIRSEMKFNGINELVEQINKDKQYALQVLATTYQDSTN